MALVSWFLTRSGRQAAGWGCFVRLVMLGMMTIMVAETDMISLSLDLDDENDDEMMMMKKKKKKKKIMMLMLLLLMRMKMTISDTVEDMKILLHLHGDSSKDKRNTWSAWTEDIWHDITNTTSYVYCPPSDSYTLSRNNSSMNPSHTQPFNYLLNGRPLTLTDPSISWFWFLMVFQVS